MLAKECTNERLEAMYRCYLAWTRIERKVNIREVSLGDGRRVLLSKIEKCIKFEIMH